MRDRALLHRAEKGAGLVTPRGNRSALRDSNKVDRRLPPGDGRPGLANRGPETSHPIPSHRSLEELSSRPSNGPGGRTPGWQNHPTPTETLCVPPQQRAGKALGSSALRESAPPEDGSHRRFFLPREHAPPSVVRPDRRQSADGRSPRSARPMTTSGVRRSMTKQTISH